MLTLESWENLAFSCSRQVYNSYWQAKYTTVIVLNFGKRAIIQYMLSSIYIFKAMRNYCSTGDFCSASRFSTRWEPRALAPTELPRRSGRLCHLIPAMRKEKAALFSVLLVFISMEVMSQSEVRVWRVILTPCFTFQMKITVSFGGLYV